MQTFRLLHRFYCFSSHVSLLIVRQIITERPSLTMKFHGLVGFILLLIIICIYTIRIFLKYLQIFRRKSDIHVFLSSLQKYSIQVG